MKVAQRRPFGGRPDPSDEAELVNEIPVSEYITTRLEHRRDLNTHHQASVVGKARVEERVDPLTSNDFSTSGAGLHTRSALSRQHGPKPRSQVRSKAEAARAPSVAGNALGVAGQPEPYRVLGQEHRELLALLERGAAGQEGDRDPVRRLRARSRG